MDVSSLAGTSATSSYLALQPVDDGMAETDAPGLPPDFGPAATFTPSEQLTKLKSRQDAAVVSSLTAGQAPVSSASDEAPAPAPSYQMYTNSGTSVALAQWLATGAVP